jgi:hypothetical protein
MYSHLLHKNGITIWMGSLLFKIIISYSF